MLQKEKKKRLSTEKKISLGIKYLLESKKDINVTRSEFARRHNMSEPTLRGCITLAKNTDEVIRG